MKTSGAKRPLKHLGNLGCLLACTLMLSCKSLSVTDRSTMAMGFVEAAYGVGIEPSGQHPVARRNNLVRWNPDEPVRLSVIGEGTDSELYKIIINELTKLYRLAAIDLSTDGAPSVQILRVTVKDESFLVTEEIKTSCYTNYDRIMDGYLRAVDIVVARDAISDRLDNCLLHEGMHSLGFSGHPHRLNSVLSYTRNLTELSDIDKQLIDLLYSRSLKKAIRLEQALTIAYSRIGQFPERRNKRAATVETSLELKENESPLIFIAPFMGSTSKQFFYEVDKSGNLSLQANYGARGAHNRFAGLFYSKLSRDLIFKKQLSLQDYIKRFESNLGNFELRARGSFNNSIGRFKYAIAESNQFSCVFTIKYIDASDLDIGGHKVIGGYYCGSVSQTLQAIDAELFIGAVRLYQRDPLAIRARKVASQDQGNRNFSALKMTGWWPPENSPVSGLKLLIQGRTDGNMKITVNGEICAATLTDIQSNGLGQWTLDCDDNEDASGRFSRDFDGSFSFRGETAVTGAEIDWVAYQVF